MSKTLAICSGGLDSAVLAWSLAKDGDLARIVSFDYGQRHKKELHHARALAEELRAPFSLVDISAVGALLSGSALTDETEVPDGHYTEDSMKATVVPNRNAIMLSIAFGIAQAAGDSRVATAVHGGDHFIYPDCRPAFTESFEAMQAKALDGYGEIALHTPFVRISKADIVALGAELGAPLDKTWSCYKGGEIHCGRCGTCVERREAFALAGVDDPTAYADPNYWTEAVARANKEGSACS